MTQFSQRFERLARITPLIIRAVAEGKHVLSKADVALKAPIHNPDKIVCIGMNYVDHCTEQVLHGVLHRGFTKLLHYSSL